MEMRKRVLGEKHPDTLTSMNNLAFTFKAQGYFTNRKMLPAAGIGPRPSVASQSTKANAKAALRSHAAAS
jgi:hypothetical protein